MTSPPRSGSTWNRQSWPRCGSSTHRPSTLSCGRTLGTGRKLLYVNEVFTTEIVGLDAGESASLLAHLCAQSRVPEYQCRFRWEPNYIALWDNRCTQHYAVSDYAPQRRVMERATIVGDRPF